MNRTHNNGELRLENVGQTVELKGWVAKKRNLGALVFIDLRDRYGITQIIINEEMENISKDIKNEYILYVCAYSPFSTFFNTVTYSKLIFSISTLSVIIKIYPLKRISSTICQLP